ncbi:23S rRNA (cytidine(2498)-2'-O)-methyltransferase RlmM [Dongshaea marina]|uniref:23S rRNA (cytidine(2498)-2'-O)-methyltransferase RlmM n=1 Tax=Dongshaea marina TaxID=2047966 RepID=UPI000D3E8729|nr:23S rRNA (cytidine(2498)-2'-O)-methyltransferase RlmM [Dongshaea marina]
MSQSHLLLYCRPGFEKECAQEVQEKAAAYDIFGYPQLEPNTGYVLFHCYEDEDADYFARKHPFSDLIFARQMIVATHELSELIVGDRVRLISQALREYPVCGNLWVETPDTEKGRELAKFCRKFTVPLRQGLRKAEILTQTEHKSKRTLHLFMLSGEHGWVGYSYSYNHSSHFMGIPRLKQPADAPSRSSLKLDEAFLEFIPAKERAARLSPGMFAVDLGAAPGGWTYQLVRRSMHVTAVDNGPMAQSLMDTGQVKHLMQDGFMYRPVKHNIYWLVCDMVEKPARVIELMAEWLCDDWCKEAIFNLKLPMKKRYPELMFNLQKLKDLLSEVSNDFVVEAKQLYHDREEVTVHVYNKRSVSRRVERHSD